MDSVHLPQCASTVIHSSIDGDVLRIYAVLMNCGVFCLTIVLKSLSTLIMFLLQPAYLNLKQRVDNFVSNHLSNHTWSPHLNKNQLRNNIRQLVLQ